MKCPIDGTPLTITDRSGVEIDYCQQCRGVWLDRGELDKIIDRASAPPAPPASRGYDDRGAQAPRGHDDRGSQDGDGYRKKKRGGFPDELFDF